MLGGLAAQLRLVSAGACLLSYRGGRGLGWLLVGCGGGGVGGSGGERHCFLHFYGECLGYGLLDRSFHGGLLMLYLRFLIASTRCFL